MDPLAGNRTLVGSARGVLLVVCTTAVAVDVSTAEALRTASVLGASAAIASWPIRRPAGSVPSARALLAGQALLEAVAVAVLVALSAPAEPAAMAYLVAPALALGIGSAAGIGCGARWLGAVLGGSAATLGTLLALRSSAEVSASLLVQTAQWYLIAGVVGLLALWLRRDRQVVVAPGNSAYESAYRLISQLRLVARQLSVGLDQVALAQSLLQSLRGVIGYERAALFVRSSGGRLLPLAFEGCESVDWPLSLEPGSLFADAWLAQRAVQRPAALTDGIVAHSAALPLRIGIRTFGLVALEDSRGPFDHQRLEDAMSLTEEAALRLETALLFAEVRSVAVVDERRRLAREIHDGIAQELASLGYVVDDLARRTDGDLHQDLRDLRTELTRVITDLRLSIFDLRSEVQQVGGLGSALSEHVRQVGASSGLTVHLVLDEGPEPLTVATEAELMRIAQEAVTNARRHAGAHNLWVTCVVDSPRALLMIEDDGVGLRAGRPDSFGLEIMRERAQRIGARLDIRDRQEGGTVVEVSVGEHTPGGVPLTRVAGGRRAHDRAAR